MGSDAEDLVMEVEDVRVLDTRRRFCRSGHCRESLRLHPRHRFQGRPQGCLTMFVAVRCGGL